jgi:hypothetical protein
MSTHDKIVKEEAIQEAVVQEALEEISHIELQSVEQKKAYNELEEFISRIQLQETGVSIAEPNIR